MKKVILTACSAMILLVACNSAETKENKTDSSSAATPEVKKENAWVPVDSATQMKAMMDYATPGNMQKMMASWNGTWNGDMTMWEFEGAAPQKMVGTAVNTMLLGGRYQSSKHTGNMMGMPFEGLSLMGYDNAIKKFVSSWIDNFGTGIMMMSGPWDEKTKSLTLTGSMPDICRPGKECTMREVFTVIDNDTQHMEMYGPDSKTGKEFKMMEIKMTRKK
jgi:hypothetical protein